MLKAIRSCTTRQHSAKLSVDGYIEPQPVAPPLKCKDAARRVLLHNNALSGQTPHPCPSISP